MIRRAVGVPLAALVAFPVAGCWGGLSDAELAEIKTSIEAEYKERRIVVFEVVMLRDGAGAKGYIKIGRGLGPPGTIPCTASKLEGRLLWNCGR